MPKKTGAAVAAFVERAHRLASGGDHLLGRGQVTYLILTGGNPIAFFKQAELTGSGQGSGQRSRPRALPTRSRTAGHGTTQSSDGCNPRARLCRPSRHRPARGYHGHGPPSRAAVAGCHPCDPEPPSPARLLFRTHRWDLGTKHAGVLAAPSTGSWPTSDGTAESCNRDGTWSGSEQSCLPSGNYRPIG
jgi:hypothetical protein